MTNPASQSIVLSNISEVERDTGVAKETLRVWERRYAFPLPLRDPNGERIYPEDQVQRLRLIKRLLDQGYRPGKIMHLDTDALAELGAKCTPPAPLRGPSDPELALCLGLLKAHQMHELRQRMAQAQLQMGLRTFVMEIVAPLTQMVGDAWAAGQLAVFEEHLYLETLQSVMRNAIFAATQHGSHATARPRILLTTVPLERHGLGLLMAEALFALEGAHCVSLGVQTPLAEIVEAARIQRADIVALSFSSVVSPRAAIDNVIELRSRLGETIQVWAGGSCAMAVRRQLGPHCVLDLNDITGAIGRWLAQHAAAQAVVPA
ncbi:MerR family transcriptional regulator [Massilia glaciei]|uniref:MerR family DNA-binding transcriptional regulator n=1 Tax=Massilia glaciei TaxID=1524097 RepID=A0A2U2HGM6_9BURK|nr:MerR family transcriptional regulator [Massilia glaciei]PWF44332.1 MerR family DNA-binding transcriptional regulator [Massilia glaciei]